MRGFITLLKTTTTIGSDYVVQSGFKFTTPTHTVASRVLGLQTRASLPRTTLRGLGLFVTQEQDQAVLHSSHPSPSVPYVKITGMCQPTYPTLSVMTSRSNF